MDRRSSAFTELVRISLRFEVLLCYFNEKRGRMGNIPASGSEDPGFQSPLGDEVTWLKSSVDFICPSR